MSTAQKPPGSRGPGSAPSDAPSDLRIEQRAISHPDAVLMVEEVQQEYVERYGGRDNTPMDPAELAPPAGAFYVAYVEGRPVAIGAWRFREDVSRLGSTHAAEVKRMYVAPSARRQGLARRMLTHLETTAHEAGADVMILETGTAQPEAMAFYEAAGYQPIEPFGHYAWSPRNRCYARVLADVDGPGPS